MQNIRGIEVSPIPPAGDKLWFLPVGTGFEMFAMLNGAWRKIGGSGSGSGITEDDLKAIEAKISSSLKEAKNYTDTEVKTVSDKIADIDLAAEKVSLSSSDTNLSSVDNVKAALEAIAAKVWYTKIAITAFNASPNAGTFEVGATVSKPTFTWTTSKTPTKTVIDGQTVTGTSYTMSSDITETKTVTLSVTESEGGVASSSKAYTFGYAVYTGMATAPSSFTQDWVKSTLGGKSIKTTAAGSYTMKGSATSQYWWLVAPSSWSISFKTSLGSGGAEKVGTIDAFVNDQGKAVPMTVYRASKVQGSDMTITVVQ